MRLRTPSWSTPCGVRESAGSTVAGPPSRVWDSSPGLALLIAGISVTPILSVLGFMIMVAAAVTAIYSWQHVGNSADPARGRDRAKTPGGSRPIEGQNFMDKMEERWRKRRDEGF